MEKIISFSKNILSVFLNIKFLKNIGWSLLMALLVDGIILAFMYNTSFGFLSIVFVVASYVLSKVALIVSENLKTRVRDIFLSELCLIVLFFTLFALGKSASLIFDFNEGGSIVSYIVIGILVFILLLFIFVVFLDDYEKGINKNKWQNILGYFLYLLSRLIIIAIFITVAWALVHFASPFIV